MKMGSTSTSTSWCSTAAVVGVCNSYMDCSSSSGTKTRTRSTSLSIKRSHARLVPNLSLSPPSSSSSSSRFRINNNINSDHDTVTVDDDTPQPPLFSSTWKWRGYSIRYQCCGDSGPALVLVHGFGANSDHWRKNLPVLGRSHRVYSIDLIGYGYSDKPNPRSFGLTCFYTFHTWASQLNDFCLQVVKDEAFFICNSIGGLVGLQAAVMEPQICKGIVLLNISLRMLHIKKQPPLARPLIKAFQSLLRNTSLGKLFYTAVATPQSVRNILCQHCVLSCNLHIEEFRRSLQVKSTRILGLLAKFWRNIQGWGDGYFCSSCHCTLCYATKVTEELVEKILLPGLEPGAVDVFLEFICYSDGPLPEELLPRVKCSVLVVWGDKDPWEPIELGRAYGNFESVEDFIVLPGVGHCPQDEAPHLVNPLVQSFVERHSATRTGVPSDILA